MNAIGLLIIIITCIYVYNFWDKIPEMFKYNHYYTVQKITELEKRIEVLEAK